MRRKHNKKFGICYKGVSESGRETTCESDNMRITISIWDKTDGNL